MAGAQLIALQPSCRAETDGVCVNEQQYESQQTVSDAQF